MCIRDSFCVVVETRGSTPQKAGATMLVFPDGGQVGTLGGGCIEAEVRQRALRRLSHGEGTAEVLTFSLDDNYGWDDGLICGGRMSILAQPLGDSCRQAAQTYFKHLHDLLSRGAGFIEAIALSVPNLPAGCRFLFDAERQLVASFGADDLVETIRAGLPDLRQRPKPQVTAGVAYLPVAERIRLLIVGAGHVGQAVAELAARVDFDIWVMDDREKYANPERFPQAKRLIIGDIGRSLKTLIDHGEITPSTYALIVTRGHNHDEEALYYLAPTDAGYVGMIGSKRKIRLIFDDLIAKGISPDTLRRVHAPLGLPIGSQTVPEIAISIVAELIQCRNLATEHRSPSSRPPV
ncbi:MAG: XdhC family protein, partial [Gemmataceae bacterium]|nr:XdhC family protein [Gemmataceae bacterium]